MIGCNSQLGCLCGVCYPIWQKQRESLASASDVGSSASKHSASDAGVQNVADDTNYVSAGMTNPVAEAVQKWDAIAAQLEREHLDKIKLLTGNGMQVDADRIPRHCAAEIARLRNEMQIQLTAAYICAMGDKK